MHPPTYYTVHTHTLCHTYVPHTMKWKNKHLKFSINIHPFLGGNNISGNSCTEIWAIPAMNALPKHSKPQGIDQK